MDHHLENLGPERFQHLCQALLVKEFPGLTCLPVAQPDGGRDALRRLGEPQLGKFTAFQVKFSRNLLTADDARQWVLDMADGEVDKVKKLIERGASQYFLITNVSGTAHLDTGSIDRLNAELTSKIGLPTQCWLRDDINRRLDGSWDVKLRYPEVLSGQDFLRLLLESSMGQAQERRRHATSAFLAQQYHEDVEVKFKQIELHNKLLDLFVDLPFRLFVRSDEGSARDLAASSLSPLRLMPSFETGTYALEDAALEGGGTATLLLGEFAHDRLNQVVVEGAPGQGKSTLAQYICQVHRIRWLGKTSDLDQLPDIHRHTSLRFPIKVDLRDLAGWLSGNDPFDPVSKAPPAEPRSLESFLARLIQHRSGGVEFDVNDLLEVARLAPPLIVLDGLDEVADLKRRADVVSAVTKALQRLRENCPAMRLIVTSRPAAFVNSPGFDRVAFPHVELGAVKRSQILTYAQRWMQAQNLAPKERAEFQAVLEEKMEQPHLRDLARNPMQLAILLSLIHSRGAALPDKRTHLYDTYVELFFSREASKSVVVRHRLDLLRDIHRYLAWVLHVEAETGRGRANGRISTSDLKELLRKYLEREQHDTTVVEEVFGAMLERVVMIVSRIEGTYEFEVQPLREYFAARYLYDTAPYSPPGGEVSGTKPDRFDAIARNFYWLNVTRFFCGCFSKGELLDLADRVKQLALDPVLGKTRHPVILAAMLSSDWVFAQVPRAVAEVATALSSRDAIWKLLLHNGYYRGSEAIQIPTECGGATVIESAFAMLESQNTRVDLSLRLSEFICANLTPREVECRWMKGAIGALKRNILQWLWVGNQLGTLQRVERSDILSVLSTSRVDQKIIGQLLSAGRYDCTLTSDANALMLTSQMLDTPAALRYDRNVESPLYLFPAFLALTNFWMFGRGILMHEPIIELATRFEACLNVQETTQRFLPAGFEDAALSISRKFAALIRTLDNGPITVSRLEEIVEECRSAWGERHAIVASACSIVHLPRTPGARPMPSTLYNRARPLCERLRHARSRAKNSGWWTEQLRNASRADDRFLFNLAYWTWANNEVVTEMIDDLSDALEQLHTEEWHNILDFIPVFIERLPRTRVRNETTVASPTGTLSSRLALLIALRDRTGHGQVIFLEHFVQNSGDHLVIAEFRQSRAFEAALAGMLEWRTALSIIRSTYASGAWSQIMSIARPRGITLPEIVAQQVLSASHDYPVHLRELAEAGAAARARKAVRPVGTVAKSERWFAIKVSRDAGA